MDISQGKPSTYSRWNRPQHQHSPRHCIPTDADIFPYTELTSVRGEETYKIHAQSGIDANGEIIWKTVGQKSIQIWPLAQAEP